MAGHTTSRASAPSSTPPTGGKGFFDLPRELRDEVYDLLHLHRRVVIQEQLAFSMPLPHIHHISATFRDEYNERRPETRHLIISPNILEFDPRHQTVTLPRLYVPCNGVQFDLNVSHQGAIGMRRDLMAYHHWIVNLLRFRMPDVPPQNVCLRFFVNNIYSYDKTHVILLGLESCSYEFIEIWRYGRPLHVHHVPRGTGLSKATRIATRAKGSNWETDLEAMARWCEEHDDDERDGREASDDQ